jgi:hypothetical protein
VTISGVPHNGTGYFKFAVVNAAGTTSYWSNDGTSVNGGQPTANVPLSVSAGLFNVLLGDTSQSGMTLALNASVFNASDRRLRTWFATAAGGPYTQLAPDRRIAASGYALNAETLDGSDSSAFALASHTHFGQTWSGSASAGLTLSNSSTTGLSASGASYGVAGNATNTTGVSYGVYGTSPSYMGVYGQGAVFGVHGTVNDSIGPNYAINGYVNNSGAQDYAVWGDSDDTGVYGVGGDTGVYGTGSDGVYGLGSTNGVYGRSDAPSGNGVYGYASATTGAAWGVFGQSASTSGIGVYGHTSTTYGVTYAVYGLNNSANGYGVYGTAGSTGVYASATGTLGTTYGVYASAGSVAVYGISSGTGVQGIGNSIGVYGTALSTVVPYSEAVYGLSDDTALHGATTNAFNDWGLYTIDDIFAGGCTGCVLSFAARNGGAEALEAGDLVAVSGVEAPFPGGRQPMMVVRKATAGDAVVGVVYRTARLQTATRPDPLLEGETTVEMSLRYAGGAAVAGDLLVIVTHGPTYVRVSGLVVVGDLLVASAEPGKAQAAPRVILEGIAVSPADVLGRVLGPPDPATGLAPVLVTLQ